MSKTHKGGVKTPPRSIPASCHPGRGAFVRGLCKSCYNAWLMKRDPTYAERQRVNNRKWMAANTERARGTAKKWLAKQDPTYRRRVALRQLGLTLEDYNEVLAFQHGKCAICKQHPKPGKNLAVDHCHSTGTIRGLLCFRCNFGLSYFAEDFERLGNAASYLVVKPAQLILNTEQRESYARFKEMAPFDILSK